MAVLLFVYAFAMAYATFVENDYGTPLPKLLIYEAKWFEVVMILLILNFIGNINRYRLWKEKITVIGVSFGFCLYFYWGAITVTSVTKGKCTSEKEKLLMKSLPIKISLKFKSKEVATVCYAEIPYMMASQEPLIAKIIPTDLRQSMISMGNLFR